MTNFVRQLQPGQHFILKRTGQRFLFLRRDRSTPSGTRHIAVLDDPYIKPKDGQARESMLHHSCHVVLEAT